MTNFKVSNNGGDDWLICWTGQDEKGVHWNVTTDQVRASELFQFSKGAEEDARLIAKLLDMHYTGQLIHTESIQSNLANYNALQTPMPCGHLARYAVNGEDGTQYCALCVLEADKQTIANLVMVDVEETNNKCPFCQTRAILTRVEQLLELTPEIGYSFYDDVIAGLINDTSNADLRFQCYCEETFYE